MSKPDICVAIPTYNRGELLIDTIENVLTQSYRNLELLVIDQTQNIDKNIIKSIKKIKDPRFRYYLADPPSLPAARNFALKHSNAPIVLFIDDDVQLTKDMVKNHIMAFNKHPEVCAVAGRVMQHDFPVMKKVLEFDDYAVSHGVFTATESGFTNAFPGGNHSIRIKDALEVGGYDTRYYGNAFREESDMSLKLSKFGKKIFYEPKAELLHLAAHSGGLESRLKGHIYDSKTFYPNELFFTLRNARKGCKLKALKRKYYEYCKLPSKRQTLRRSYFYFMGLVKAILRVISPHMIITKERNK